MPQTAISRQGKSKPPAYWETIRDRIDSAKAVGVINDVLHDKPGISMMQAQMAWKVADKLLPSLQAVALAVHEQAPATKYDLDALMLSTGIDPASIKGWEDKPLITQEKQTESDESMEAPHTRDSSE